MSKAKISQLLFRNVSAPMKQKTYLDTCLDSSQDFFASGLGPVAGVLIEASSYTLRGLLNDFEFFQPTHEIAVKIFHS